MGHSVKVVRAVIPEGEALSQPIHMADFVQGIVIMPDEWTDANLGIQVGAEPDDCGPMTDKSNAYSTDVNIAAVAGGRHPLPDYIYSAVWIRLWSHDGDGNDAEQAAERELTLKLKSSA